MDCVGRVWPSSPLVVAALPCRRGQRLGGAADRPRRDRASGSAVNAKGEALLTYHKGGAIEARPRLGRDQRARPRAGDAAGEVPASTTRAAGASTARCTGRHFARHVRPRTTAPRCRTSSPPARRRTARTGRRRAGRSRCPTSASRRGSPTQQRSTGSRSRTGRGPVAQLETGMRLGLRRPLPELFGRLHVQRPAGATASARRAYGAPTDGFGRLDLPRHVQLGVRPGLAARELVRRAQPDGRLLLRLLPVRPDEGRLPAIRPARPRSAVPASASSTASSPRGPGVTPDVAVIVPGLHPFDRATRRTSSSSSSRPRDPRRLGRQAAAAPA